MPDRGNRWPRSLYTTLDRSPRHDLNLDLGTAAVGAVDTGPAQAPTHRHAAIGSLMVREFAGGLMKPLSALLENRN